MTGYGKAEFCQSDINITVEIKTINNRYLDINIKMPRMLLPLEDKIRKLISSRLNRGRADIYINLYDKREKEINVNIDMGLVKGYIAAAKMLNEKLDIVNDINVSNLFKMPDIVKTDDKNNDSQQYSEMLSNCVMLALDNLNTMRQNEGMAIKNDILKKLNILKDYTKKIELKAPLVVENYKTRLNAKITEALDKVEIDQTRLLNEVAFFTDKSSIDEELIRLKSHYSQLENILKETEPTGRKLDFLVQELNREVNTICSKSTDTDITNNALILKSEIEKIREQVQNIE